MLHTAKSSLVSSCSAFTNNKKITPISKVPRHGTRPLLVDAGELVAILGNGRTDGVAEEIFGLTIQCED